MEPKNKFFYSNNDEKKGPFNFDELKNEDILPDTLIWFEGLDDLELTEENIGKLMYPSIETSSSLSMDDFIESSHDLFENFDE